MFAFMALLCWVGDVSTSLIEFKVALGMGVKTQIRVRLLNCDPNMVARILVTRLDILIKPPFLTPIII